MHSFNVINVIALSDTHGQYRLEKLPAGEYRMQIRAVGFRTGQETIDPKRKPLRRCTEMP